MTDPAKPAPPPEPPPFPPGGYSPDADERQTAMWAHLGAALANWVLGGQGWLVALIIFFVKKESRFVKFHALQELFLQIAVAIVSIVCVVTGIFCCFPFFFIPIVFIGSLIAGILVGMKANDGYWTEYWVVGPLARDMVLKESPPPASPGATPPP